MGVLTVITPVNQRWRAHRDSYRPAGEPIDTRAHEVAAIDSDNVARAFVLEHHYSDRYPAAQYRFGLYRGPALVGVAVFSVPVNDAALRELPGSPRENTELGRFVLLDQVPANGETWFLARCFDALRREQLNGVLSNSDPMPRDTAGGAVVFPGHVGTIYQAFNANYRGQGGRNTIRLLPDGAVFCRYAQQKIRAQTRGWRYAVEQLVAAGAAPLGDECPRAWLRRELARVTRARRHPGNHRYLWGLNRHAVRHLRRLPEGPAYPKFDRRPAA